MLHSALQCCIFSATEILDGTILHITSHYYDIVVPRRSIQPHPRPHMHTTRPTSKGATTTVTFCYVCVCDIHLLRTFVTLSNCLLSAIASPLRLIVFSTSIGAIVAEVDFLELGIRKWY